MSSSPAELVISEDDLEVSRTVEELAHRARRLATAIANRGRVHEGVAIGRVEIRSRRGNRRGPAEAGPGTEAGAETVGPAFGVGATSCPQPTLAHKPSAVGAITAMYDANRRMLCLPSPADRSQPRLAQLIQDRSASPPPRRLWTHTRTSAIRPSWTRRRYSRQNRNGR